MTTQFQYSVVRFVPNVVRDEAVNVGIVVRDVKSGATTTKFLPRNATVRKLWPEADDRLVENFRKQLDGALKSGETIGLLGSPLDDVFLDTARRELNGNLQLTPPHGLLEADPESAVSYLYELYVAPPSGSARPINFQAVAPITARNRLWAAFENRGLVRPGLVRERVRLSGKHAPWTFDVVYRNGNLNLVHSVAINAPTLETNLGRALVMKGMLEDVRARYEEKIEATAVTLTGSSGDAPGARQATRLMADAEIEVVKIGELAGLVDRVEAQLQPAQSA